MVSKSLTALLKNLSKQFPAKKLPQRVPYPSLPSTEALTAHQQWVSLLWSIDSAQAHGKHALRGLAISLSQIIRAQALQSLLMDAREFQKPAWDAEDLLWDESLPLNAAGDTRASLLTRTARTLSVNLNDATVFAAPWERWRLFRALQNLGTKRRWGSWRQDPNHFGIAWKPWPIVWVTNGNHSTMAALIRGGGKFKCHAAYDFRLVIEAVGTDGVNWFRLDTGAVLEPVRSLPMAAIFEIGRRLLS